jgi:hypothetical protein
MKNTKAYVALTALLNCVGGTANFFDDTYFRTQFKLYDYHVELLWPLPTAILISNKAQETISGFAYHGHSQLDKTTTCLF